MVYGISAREYLARAKSNLSNPDCTFLFYAAFELRACIEARQDEYVDAQQRYLKSLPKSEKIGKKAKLLARICKPHLITALRFVFDDGDYFVYYTPVSNNLHKKVKG